MPLNWKGSFAIAWEEGLNACGLEYTDETLTALVSVLIHRSDGPVPDWGQDFTVGSLMECEGILGLKA